MTENTLSFDLVDKFYGQDIETEELLFDGTELREGMVVLLGRHYERVGITKAMEVGLESLPMADQVQILEKARWCTVGRIQLALGVVHFFAIYADGTTIKRSVGLTTPWLVKRDSIPVAEEKFETNVAYGKGYFNGQLLGGVLITQDENGIKTFSPDPANPWTPDPSSSKWDGSLVNFGTPDPGSVKFQSESPTLDAIVSGEKPIFGIKNMPFGKPTKAEFDPTKRVTLCGKPVEGRFPCYLLEGHDVGEESTPCEGTELLTEGS